MPSADRHLGELELLERAMTPGLAPDPHAASCPTCRDRIEGLAAGREHLADLAAPATEAKSGPRVPVPAALSRLSRPVYAAHGFDTVGLRKRYYRQSGADAYTMCRPAPARP